MPRRVLWFDGWSFYSSFLHPAPEHSPDKDHCHWAVRRTDHTIHWGALGWEEPAAWGWWCQEEVKESPDQLAPDAEWGCGGRSDQRSHHQGLCHFWSGTLSLSSFQISLIGVSPPSCSVAFSFICPRSISLLTVIHFSCYRSSESGAGNYTNHLIYANVTISRVVIIGQCYYYYYYYLCYYIFHQSKFLVSPMLCVMWCDLQKGFLLIAEVFWLTKRSQLPRFI